MNKRTVMVGATVGMIIGSYVPALFGASPFGGWSILGGMFGGFFGIWFVARLSKRYG